MSWNRGSEAMRGFTANETIRQPVPMFYTPGDRESGLAERELRASTEAGPAEFEGWRVRKDGKWFWANVVVVPIRNGNGTMSGYVNATRDITGQKRAETLFRGLLESAPRTRAWPGCRGRVGSGGLRPGRAAGDRPGGLRAAGARGDARHPRRRARHRRDRPRARTQLEWRVPLASDNGSADVPSA
jgi:PAS domain S-box-containing protein